MARPRAATAIMACAPCCAACRRPAWMPLRLPPGLRSAVRRSFQQADWRRSSPSFPAGIFRKIIRSGVRRCAPQCDRPLFLTRPRPRRAYISEISMFITRLAAGLLAISAPNALAESAQIVAVSGRDQLALHDLANGAELARFDAKGGSSDMVALPSGIVLSNHTGGNAVLLVDVRKRTEIGRIPSSALGGTRPVHMYLTPALAGKQ